MWCSVDGRKRRFGDGHGSVCHSPQSFDYFVRMLYHSSLSKTAFRFRICVDGKIIEKDIKTIVWTKKSIRI